MKDMEHGYGMKYSVGIRNLKSIAELLNTIFPNGRTRVTLDLIWVLFKLVILASITIPTVSSVSKRIKLY